MNTKTLNFSLNISSSQVLRYYQGDAKYLIVTVDDGQRVQLPLINFRPFIGENGLQGDFEVTFNSDFKLLELKKI